MSRQQSHSLALAVLLYYFAAHAAPSVSNPEKLLIDGNGLSAFNASNPALLASSLGLTQRWVAASPATSYASFQDGARDVSEELKSWQLWSDTMYGGDWSNLAFVDEPFPFPTNLNDGNEGGQHEEEEKQVLQVDYPKGSYRQGSDASTGGATFFPSPRSLSASGASTALFSYEVAFAPDFDWVKGGKLPGLFSGPTPSSCSGGAESNQGDCFSTRMMWRSGGMGEVYAYLPSQNRLCPANATSSALPSTPASIICNEDYGSSLSRGSFLFDRGGYTQISMFVRMNTAPKKRNGILRVWANGQPILDMENLILSGAKPTEPLRIFFSTFFGGSTPDWASAADTKAYFRNLQVWIPQSHGDTPSSSAAITSAEGSYIPCIMAALAGLSLVLR